MHGSSWRFSCPRQVLGLLNPNLNRCSCEFLSKNMSFRIIYCIRMDLGNETGYHYFTFRHSLRSVLRADWERVSPATQTHLTVTLQRFTYAVSSSKKYPSILHQCRVLESIVKKPWKHPTLEKVFKNEEPEINGKFIISSSADCR